MTKPWEPPASFNLAHYFLDHNLEAGRGAKVALRTEVRDWTYAELHAESCRVSDLLRRFGVRYEERVLLAVSDGPEFVATWFGVLRAGAVFAMVNPLLPAEDYAYYLEYTRCSIAVVDAQVAEKLREHLPDARHLRCLVVVGGEPRGLKNAVSYDREVARSSASPHCADTSPDDLAGWLFTSGSTGKPKAVVHLHRDFAYNTEHYAKQVLGFRESDVTLSISKLFFGYGTGTNLMFPFAVGATTVLFPDRPTPERLFELIERFRPTVLTAVPTSIGAMLEHPLAKETRDLSSLRCVLSAGEALPPELLQRWMQRFGVEILDGIGSAEMFHIYISNYPGEVVAGSLGKLVPGYEARIVDDAGRDVPDGEVGLLHVRGGSTGLWYHGAYEKSRETFHGAWCRTQDFFRRDAEGRFWYQGRSDDLLKVGGIFVSPLEIEDCLLQHPQVLECCVVGADDEGGLVKPFAWVVPQPGVARDEVLRESVKGWVRERLARYKFPRWVGFLEALPRNDRGKVARKELRARAAAEEKR
ncbi:MAG: benzoate-CoA ligase family protein [Planctomycetes bacterium]|nr:benzoate-CoA ligase family protein [Planctomycetota bacterium]